MYIGDYKFIVERKNTLRISQGMLTLLSLAAILASGSCDRGEQGNWLLTTARFEQLMQTISDGWNEGNAQKAANCFTEDAIYSAPWIRNSKEEELRSMNSLEETKAAKRQ